MSLSIGVLCYPSVGGSGIIATEIGLGMAARGHQVHFITRSRPHRLPVGVPNVHLHPVSTSDYHVFAEPPYALALASALVRVAQTAGLDVVHAHYAVPHAACAWMAKEMLGGALRVVTTLHGTDITLVGSDASYLPITRHSILRSDAVTAPSAFLRDDTYARLGIDPSDCPIQVVPNFVDTDFYRPRAFGEPDPTAGWFPGHEGLPLLVHVSNFRPLKRVDRVLDVAVAVARQRPCRLLLVGDGPDAAAIDARLEGLGLPAVRVAGDVAVEQIVRAADVFLLPSETESFGLAALEALASGVPVVASRVGGLPEVVQHGVNGWLVAPDDVQGMADAAVAVLAAGPAMRAAARADAAQRFPRADALDGYERLYR
jgi:N-acetyl-alpha-D-glucosaminyl L-malate synthase BshA